MNKIQGITKQGETDIWNEITKSTLPYNIKIKVLNRLRKNHLPKFKIQRNIEDFTNKD